MQNYSLARPLGALALAGVSLFLVPACGTRTMNVPAPATFSSIEALSIGPKCVQCHQTLSTYAGVMQVVSAGNAAKSRLYSEISSGDMPRQSPNLSSAEVAAIYTWIQSGAPND